MKSHGEVILLQKTTTSGIRLIERYTLHVQKYGPHNTPTKFYTPFLFALAFDDMIKWTI